MGPRLEGRGNLMEVELKKPPTYASMGPRLEGRGNGAQSGSRIPQCYCFNGAAS